MLLHTLYSLKNNTILLYSELITKNFVCTNYNLEEEEPEFMHSKLEKGIVSKMGYIVQGK